MNLDYITNVEEANEEIKKYNGGSLSLDGLTSAEGLVLPEKIGGWLSLNGLTSAEGLVLPTKIGDSLFLNGLTNEERAKIKR